VVADEGAGAGRATEAASAALSVVIPTRDRPERLAECLAALAASLRPGDEVVVVDSASVGGGTKEAADAAGAAYLRAPVPGASFARNLGWRAATHRLVAFVDDDVRVSPGWAEGMRTAMDAPSRAFVTGPIRLPAGTAGLGTQLESDDARSIGRETRGAFGASCNLGVHRSVLEAVGGFDERFGPATWTRSAEDGDLFDRLVLGGFNGWYEPSAWVVHDDRRTPWEHVRLAYGYGKGAGARLARLTYTARGRARTEGADLVWRGGFVALGRTIAARHEWAALATLALLAGQLAGYVRGLIVLKPERVAREGPAS
jgi:glycosyltransferase involved in cell wall biosynthesis